MTQQFHVGVFIRRKQKHELEEVSAPLCQCSVASLVCGSHLGVRQ